MEHKNHPIEKANHLNQTFIMVFQPLIFRGVESLTGRLCLCSDGTGFEHGCRLPGHSAVHMFCFNTGDGFLNDTTGHH